MGVSNAMKAHLQGTVTVGVFLKITAKDGDVIRVWNGTRDKIVGGELYKAFPVAPSQLQAANGLKADNLEVTSIYSGLFTNATLRAKKWQGARVEYQVLNYKDFSMGYAERRVAFLGRTDAGKHSAKVELNTLSSKLNEPWGRTINPECDVDRLGDSRCTVDLNGYTATGFKIKAAAHVVAPILNRQQFSVVIDTPGFARGLAAAYYEGPNFQTLKFQRIDPAVNFDWTSSSPGADISFENYSARWQGTVTPPHSGTWTFEVEHDNGARLWVNNLATPLIDSWANDGNSSPATSTATINLTAGTAYNIRLEYNQGPGNPPQNVAKVRLRWSHASQPLQIIPSAVLAPAGAVAIPDLFYQRGTAKFLTGPNAGVEAQILTNSDGALTLYLPLFYLPQLNDQLELEAGCDRKIGTCRIKYANAINHRGYPFLPGRSRLLKVPE